MRSNSIVIGVLVAALAGQGMAGVSIFFGEDIATDPVSRMAAWPNADAASADFEAMLTSGVSTEDFEGFANHQMLPLALTFTGSYGAIGATITSTSGSLAPYVCNWPTGVNGGRFPTSGDQYLETSNYMRIDFDAPVAAFGFYGTDISDRDGQLTVTTVSGKAAVYNVGNTANAQNGSVLFWGIVNDDDLFTTIEFGNTAAGTDWFGFDDMTIGDVEQIVPAPGAALLGMIGLGTLRFIRRRLA